MSFSDNLYASWCSRALHCSASPTISFVDGGNREEEKGYYYIRPTYRTTAEEKEVTLSNCVDIHLPTCVMSTTFTPTTYCVTVELDLFKWFCHHRSFPPLFALYSWLFILSSSTFTLLRPFSNLSTSSHSVFLFLLVSFSFFAFICPRGKRDSTSVSGQKGHHPQLRLTVLSRCWELTREVWFMVSALSRSRARVVFSPIVYVCVHILWSSSHFTNLF